MKTPVLAHVPDASATGAAKHGHKKTEAPSTRKLAEALAVNGAAQHGRP